MIVPERLRYVIIVVLINIFHVACRVSRREAFAKTSQCRPISTTILDCSYLSLTSIPNDIPNTILALNMSFNQILLNEETFVECCSQLEELDLSSNDISNVNRESFKKLTNITKLNLRNNSISDLEPETFESNTKLVRLDLSQNPLKLQSTTEGFLINSRLEELNLEECELTEIPEGGFHGVPQLKVLKLGKNLFDEDMDVSAFEDLTSLIKLEMKNISRDRIFSLCEKLISIDAINFEGFNVSCLILQGEDDFEDSIVGPDAAIELPKQLPILPEPPKKTTTPSTITISKSTTATSLPELPTEKSNSSSSSEVIETNDHSSSQNSVTNLPDITNRAVVDIDNETIKYILMGILGVTLIGMFIGFVCRTDVCGIKTKMCRSKKSTTANRRSPSDTVSPFEEIPLNSINTNGKAIEGQG